MKRTTTFTKGSGCYKCGCCGRKTRDDGNGDSVNVLLCTECFEIGGIENSITDGIYRDDVQRQEWIDEIKELVSRVTKLGGTVTSEYI